MPLRHPPFGPLAQQPVFELVGSLPAHRLLLPLVARMVVDPWPPTDWSEPALPQPFAFVWPPVLAPLPLLLPLESPLERQLRVLVWAPLARWPCPLWALLAVRDPLGVVIAQGVPLQKYQCEEPRVREAGLLVLALVLLVAPAIGVQRVRERLL